ncbi:MAG: M28 family peptidase [Chitinophagales bacterium]|nr:M28 family peptidase [Chitinophagales bacterium]
MSNFGRIIIGAFAGCFFTLSVHPQSALILRAHAIIDTLTSSGMHGRGYVDSGEWKAAQYISTQYRELSLLEFNKDYFQKFSLDANTFPGTASVTINHQKLFPARDFLIDPVSSGTYGKYKTLAIKNNSADTSDAVVKRLILNLKHKRLKNRVVTFQKEDFTSDQFISLKKNLVGANCLGARGCIEFSNEKLTWDASQKVLPFFYLQVKENQPEQTKVCVKANFENKFLNDYPTQNVIAYVKGTYYSDSFLVFTAHYDHLGEMGHGTYFPGANDNASGIAMLLCLANYFSIQPPRYSVVFMAFSGEESGLVGSHFYVNHPLFPLSKIKFLINLDIVGTGGEGIKVVNATLFEDQFNKLVSLNDSLQFLKVISPRGKAANSDQYFFSEAGVPSFFIYTMGGISAYHDINDRPETLPLTKFEELYNLLIVFAGSF